MTNPDPKILKLVADIQAKYGEDSIMMAGEVPVRPAKPSGSLALDFAIGIGGLPSDRVIEVAGDEGSGKTTLGLLALKTFLTKDPTRHALILDLEHKLTADWAIQHIGQEMWENQVLYAQPDFMEQATNMYVDIVGSGLVQICLIDSIGGAPTKAATEKEAEKVQVGGNAGAVTKFARLASTYSAKYNCLTFCVNQVRDDMEGFRRHMTPGGRGFKHACILRIKLRKSTQDKVEAVVNGEKMVVGHKIFASIIKNQLAPPGRTAWWWFYNVDTPEYGFGIDTMDEIVRLAILTGVIKQRVSYYDHPGLTNGTVKGVTNLAKAIAEDETLRQSIVSETMAVLNTDDGGLLAEVAPLDPEAIEQDVTVDAPANE